jgi:hypothetical protein
VTGVDHAPGDHATDGADPPGTGRPTEPRPWIERIGLAGIAIVMAGLFGTVGAAAWYGDDGFLAAMGAIGCLMTLWVGALTLVRG